MFMSYLWVYRSLIKIDKWVNRNSFFSAEYYFLYLFGGIWVKLFQWKSHSLIFSRSWLRSFAEVSMPWATGNKDVSSANNMHLLLISSHKSLIYIKITKVPKWILVVHQRGYQPKTNTNNLKRLFAFCRLGGPLKYWSFHRKYHFDTA